jgi:predicted NBD/HSP70 family sugar kinase
MQQSGKIESAQPAEALAPHARGSNQSGVRAHNERLVLTLVRQAGALPKAEIARITGLSAQTVSVIMRALEAEGLLRKGAPVRGKVGQPSVPMSLVAEGAFFFGLKVGRSSLDLVLIDFHGKVVARRTGAYRVPEPGPVVDFARAGITALLAELPLHQHPRVAGLGIAMPFRMQDWAESLGLEPGAMDAWKTRDIAAEIAATHDFPVYLRNDASAACGAELVFGAQSRPRDFLYFNLGFFVGGGLVLDNALYTGRTGNAAALGSIPIGLEGAQPQQLVDVASLVALEQALLAEGHSADVIWQGCEDWPIPEPVLEGWLTRAAEAMAAAIFPCACLIDFESVLIDGWMPAAVRQRLVARTAEALDRISLAGIDLPDVRAGTIGPDARVLGAASLPLSERFLVDRKAFLKG